MAGMASAIALLLLSTTAAASVTSLDSRVGRNLQGCLGQTWFASRKVEDYWKATNNNYNLGRQSVYEGPLGHTGMCGWPLFSDTSNNAVGVAIGRTWLTHADRSACGRCMCIRVLTTDVYCNINAPKATNDTVAGKILKGRVIDQCPECEGHHIDFLLDGPYSDADNVSGNNPRNGEANARWRAARGSGYRPLLTAQQAKTTGIFITEWRWASSCSEDCEGTFAAFDGPQRQTGGRRPTARRSPPPSKPSTPRKSPSPSRKSASPPRRSPSPKNTGSCRDARSEYQQCGGRGGPNSQNRDAAWSGVCCRSGLRCTRQSEWWWACRK